MSNEPETENQQVISESPSKKRKANSQENPNPAIPGSSSQNPNIQTQDPDLDYINASSLIPTTQRQNMDYIDPDRSQSETAMIQERYANILNDIAKYVTRDSVGFLQKLAETNRTLNHVRSLKETVSDFMALVKISDGFLRQIQSSSHGFTQFTCAAFVQKIQSSFFHNSPVSNAVNENEALFNATTAVPAKRADQNSNNALIPEEEEDGSNDIHDQENVDLGDHSETNGAREEDSPSLTSNIPIHFQDPKNIWNDITTENWHRVSSNLLHIMEFSPQSHEFLNGMFGKSVPIRKKKKQTKRAKKAVETQVGDLTEESGQESEHARESTKRLSELTGTLVSTTRITRGVGDDAFKFIYSPSSFTQTVENCFDLSFLVADDVAKVYEYDNKPLVVSVSQKEKKRAQASTADAKNQFILTLDTALFQNMKDLYGVDIQSIIPLRTPPSNIDSITALTHEDETEGLEEEDD